MDVKVEFSFYVMGAEFTEANRPNIVNTWVYAGAQHPTYWASSQVTISDKPILYIRVKKARAVNIRGAIRNSYSSRVDNIDD